MCRTASEGQNRTSMKKVDLLVLSPPKGTNAEAAKPEKLGTLPVQGVRGGGLQVRDPESKTESVHEAC